MALRIHDVAPTQGWPGTIVEIRGEGFDPHRDANTVIVGNRPALVLRAEPERLLVMAAEDARTGEIRVDVGPDSAEGPPFELLPYPEEHDWVAPAPPRFFHGPQGGTPSRNVQNQRVLVLPVYTTETPPVPPVPPAAVLAALDTKYAQVANYLAHRHLWRDHLEVRAPPRLAPASRSGDFYIISQLHIDAARRAYLAADRRIVGDSGVIFCDRQRRLHPGPPSLAPELDLADRPQRPGQHARPRPAQGRQHPLRRHPRRHFRHLQRRRTRRGDVGRLGRRR